MYRAAVARVSGEICTPSRVFVQAFSGPLRHTFQPLAVPPVVLARSKLVRRRRAAHSACAARLMYCFSHALLSGHPQASAISIAD